MSFADRIKSMVKHPDAVCPPHVFPGKDPQCSRCGFYDAGRDVRVVPPLIETSPVDLGKAARKAIRDRREHCEHSWVTGKKFTFVRDGQTFVNTDEVCSLCKDRFPCAGLKCQHIDCIEAGYALGRAGFPRDINFNVDSINIAAGHRRGDDCPACSIHPEEHHLYLVTFYEDPETWITAIPLEPKK